MRRFIGLAVVMGLWLMGPALAEDASPQSEVEVVAEPVSAAGAQFKDGGGKPLGELIKSITFKGELRTRFEVWVNPTDADDDLRDNADFFDARERLGLGFELVDDVSVYIEVQGSHVWGGDSGVNQPALVGDDDDAEVFLAYVDVGTTLPIAGSTGTEMELNVRIGRQEITLPGEMLLGDNSSYDGRSVDGLHFTTDDGAGLALGFAYARLVENDIIDTSTGTLPGERTIRVNKVDADADADFYGLYGIYDGLQDARINAYLLYLTSREDDGTGDAVYGTYGDLNIWTFGARGAFDGKVGDQDMDGHAEIAVQFGDEGDTDDISAFAGELEVGWTYQKGQEWEIRLAAGLNYATGDGDATDTDQDRFNPLLGDVEDRLGKADALILSNIFAWYLEATAKPTADTELGIAFLMANAEEEDDVVAGGVPRGVGADDDAIGSELDIWGGYDVTDNLALSTGLCLLMPDEYMTGDPGEDDTMYRFFVEAKVVW